MFENLTEKLVRAFRHVSGVATLSEKNVEEALQDVRAALLGADVHFSVVNEFTEEVKRAALGQSVTQSVSPGQQFVKTVNDALVRFLGDGQSGLSEARPLRVVLVGLHGSGKTTTAAKLGCLLKKKGYTPAVVACDVYRPAAIEQLEMLAQKNGLLCYSDRTSKDVCRIARAGAAWAQVQGADAIIFDTAGRLQIDEPLIEEVRQLRGVVSPEEVLLVADSALGQEAVNVARRFHEAVQLTGVVLTKLDGDARGGAALSMKSVTRVPIKFVGMGEKVEDLDVFYPDRMAQRMLGMGDVVSLVEKASANVEKKEMERLAERFENATFDLEDFLAQLQQINKIGSLTSLANFLPGASGLHVGDREEKHVKRMQSIILSMTRQERKNPNILNGNRRVRIALGAGLEVKDVNQLLKLFQKMKTFMEASKGGKGKHMLRKMAHFMTGSGSNPLLG